MIRQGIHIFKPEPTVYWKEALSQELKALNDEGKRVLSIDNMNNGCSGFNGFLLLYEYEDGKD